MANWVIRRKADGLYWSGGGWREHLRDAYEWSQFDRDADASKPPLRRLCNEGEEWVELDDAGQPVEAAKPVRMWVVRRISDGCYFPSEAGPWPKSVGGAVLHRETYADPRDDREWVPVLVHPDGTVTLDEPAPAVAQGANAGPVVGWVLTDGKGFYERGTGNFVRDLERAAAYPCKQEVWSSGQASVPFGHRDDGSRFLLPTAPAVAQPSPYSEDEPIPYRLTGRRVYLASALPNRGRATALAAQLARDGVEIVSTWHDRDDATVEREAAVDRNELAAIAEGCLAEIDSATDLVWMHGHAEGRVGAAVEVGYALARGKRLLLLSLDGSPAPSAFGALGAAVTVSGLYRAVAR